MSKLREFIYITTLIQPPSAFSHCFGYCASIYTDVPCSQIHGPTLYQIRHTVSQASLDWLDELPSMLSTTSIDQLHQFPPVPLFSFCAASTHGWYGLISVFGDCFARGITLFDSEIGIPYIGIGNEGSISSMVCTCCVTQVASYVATVKSLVNAGAHSSGRDG